MNTVVTQKQIRLVQESFSTITDLSEPIGKLFFGRLFEIDPTLRGMFPKDVGAQSRKVMAALTAVVENLHRFEKVHPSLKALGQRHVGYGVKTEHYDVATSAMLWAFGAALENDFYPEMKAAWRAALEAMTASMKDGAAQLQRA